MGSVRACCGATEASLIVIIHLLLRLHITHIVALGSVLLIMVVPFIVHHLAWIVQYFRTRMIPLQDHGTARPLLKANAAMLLL